MFSFHFLHQFYSCFIKPLKRRTSGWRCSKGMNSMFSSNGWIADFSGKCSDNIYIQSSYLEPVIINHGKVQVYQPLISWIFWHSRHLPHTPQKDSGGQTISFEICFDMFINQNRKPGISWYGLSNRKHFNKRLFGTSAKKKRENVGIFPKSGTPPLPPVWEFFSRFYRLFLGGLPC